jgi:4-amino-4-deoxy-L-arabinose transferase-like glycosyltransferase
MRAAQTAGAERSGLALWGLAVALAIGAVLRFWGLSSQSLFLDEAFTFDAARLPVPAMLHFIAAHDSHPPLFYLIAHAAVATLQWPLPWFRFLTAPLGLLTIVATWALARRAFGDLAAAAAAIIVATEPTLILFDRLFRMYSILTALTATSFWLMLSACRAEGKRKAALASAYALTAIALPYVQYLGALVVAVQGAYALADVRRRWPIIAGGTLSLIALLPWWWGIREQLPQSGYAGGQAVSGALALARGVLGYATPVDWYRTSAFDVFFTLGVSALVLAGLWLARGGIVGLYAAPLAIQAIATIAYHRDLVYGRYLVHLIPGFAIAASAVVSTLLLSRARIAGIVLAGALLAVNGVADTNLVLDKFYQLSDWNTVANIISANESRSDAMVFDQGYAYIVLKASPAVRGHAILGPEQPRELPAALRWLDARAGARVWYVENQYQYPDPDRKIKKHLDATRPRLRAWLEPKADPSNMVYVALYGPQERHK